MRLTDLRRGLSNVGESARGLIGGRSEPQRLPRHEAPPKPHKNREEYPGLKNLSSEAEMADPIGTTLEPTAPPQQVQHLAIAGQDIRREADDEAALAVDQLVTGNADDASPLVGATNPADDDLVLPGEEGGEW